MLKIEKVVGGYLAYATTPHVQEEWGNPTPLNRFLGRLQENSSMSSRNDDEMDFNVVQKFEGFSQAISQIRIWDSRSKTLSRNPLTRKNANEWGTIRDYRSTGLMILDSYFSTAGALPSHIWSPNTLLPTTQILDQSSDN